MKLIICVLSFLAFTGILGKEHAPLLLCALDGGSGSTSGSGASFVTVAPLLDTTASAFIRLTFSGLTQQQYHESVQEELTELILCLLDIESNRVNIDLSTEEVSDSATVVLVYIADSDVESLQAYIVILNQNTEWRRFSLIYDLSMIEVVSLDSIITWWQWVLFSLCGFIALSGIISLFIAYCQHCCGKRKKRKMPSYDKHRPSELEMGKVQEQKRQKLVRKVSRISFQSKEHIHFHSHPLSVADLERLVANPLRLLSEYAMVPSNMVTMAEVPPGAEEKNRYRDVLPNPQTRVALFLKFGVPNSDYINANYIRGFRDVSKSYIATQGPLHWTVADFWRMIWEQRSSTIVMMTGFQEKGMAKCVRYWPEEIHSHSDAYEELVVHLMRRTSTKHYTTTTFLLQHKYKMVSREVTHFWFTGWPDHGVPSSAQPVVDFLLHVQKHIRDIPGPTVVHCSAGIGRTGVFIAADIGIQQLKESGEVDVLRILSSLRQDRGGMIQTKEQYLYLHKVLLQYSRIGGLHVEVGSQLEPPREDEEAEASSENMALL